MTDYSYNAMGAYHPTVTAIELFACRTHLSHSLVFWQTKFGLPLEELLDVDVARLTNLLVDLATAVVILRVGIWAGFKALISAAGLLSSGSEKIPLDSVPVEVTISSSFFTLLALDGAILLLKVATLCHNGFDTLLTGLRSLLREVGAVEGFGGTRASLFLLFILLLATTTGEHILVLFELTYWITDRLPPLVLPPLALGRAETDVIRLRLDIFSCFFSGILDSFLFTLN